MALDLIALLTAFALGWEGGIVLVPCLVASTIVDVIDPSLPVFPVRAPLERLELPLAIATVVLGTASLALTVQAPGL